MSDYKCAPAAPPSYNEAMGGVSPSAPLAAPQHTIIPGPTIVTTIVPLGPGSTHMVCPYCNSEILTTTRSSPGLIAYLSGAVIAFVGCFCGCCLIPCCFGSCMDVHHSCPQCKAFLGRYRR